MSIYLSSKLIIMSCSLLGSSSGTKLELNPVLHEQTSRIFFIWRTSTSCYYLLLHVKLAIVASGIALEIILITIAAPSSILVLNWLTVTLFQSLTPTQELLCSCFSRNVRVTFFWTLVHSRNLILCTNHTFIRSFLVPILRTLFPKSIIKP